MNIINMDIYTNAPININNVATFLHLNESEKHECLNCMNHYKNENITDKIMNCFNYIKSLFGFGISEWQKTVKNLENHLYKMNEIQMVEMAEMDPPVARCLDSKDTEYSISFIRGYDYTFRPSDPQPANIPSCSGRLHLIADDILKVLVFNDKANIDSYDGQWSKEDLSSDDESKVLKVSRDDLSITRKMNMKEVSLEKLFHNEGIQIAKSVKVVKKTGEDTWA